MVLSTSVEHRLYAKVTKCEFWLDRVQFLGHVVSKDGIFIDPVKIEAVNKWYAPTNISETQNFLGIGSSYGLTSANRVFKN